jgi:tagatose-1,6-bisphosphate aldolase
VILVQVIFTPLLALWAIWVGIAISTRSNDIRAAQQLSALANLPLVALSTLVAFNVIAPTLRLALVFGVALVVVDRLGWRVVSAMFDRERLITSTR